MADQDDRWLPPSQGSPPGEEPSEGAPGTRAAPEQPGSGWGAPAPATSATGPEPGSGKAVASLVLGILGLPFLCPLVVPSILALVFGYGARGAYDRWGGQSSNRGMATAGIVLGWIGVAFAVVIVALIIVFAATGDLTRDSDGDDMPDWLDEDENDPRVSLIAPVARAGLRALTGL